MKYMGSKNRIAKYILPIILQECDCKGITTWVEPFVGGGNMIDKVPSTFRRIGIDSNPHTIAALIAIRDLVDDLPDEVSLEYYRSIKGSAPDPVNSLIRFGASFGGKFENGYARREGRSMWREAVRNAQKQSPRLSDIELILGNYDRFSNLEECLIYCDPPYQGTTSYKTGTFDHDLFWGWCRKMSENNSVFVSEYNAPDDFECLWEGEIKTNFSSTRKKATHNAIEKLFKWRG